MFSRSATLYCAAALLLFTIVAYAAVSTKSPTFDEPQHTVISYIALHDGDFSVEPEHPPLWKYWAALPLVLRDPPFNPRTDIPLFHQITDKLDFAVSWAHVALYLTPGNDPDHAVAACRFMMLLCGVGLGAVLARFAYRLAGPVAACTAVTLFALDPNFLAHAPIVKNDVALALLMTALAYCLDVIAERVTLPRAVTLALLCAACVTTKLTGVLAAPIVVGVLVARALLPMPWPLQLGTRQQDMATNRRRLLVVAGLCIACFLVTYLTIWAVYRFRFNPSPDPSVHYNTAALLKHDAYGETAARANREGREGFDPREMDAWTPGPVVRAMLLGLDHHLLPEPFLEGFIFAHASAGFRQSYLRGETYGGARWSYFPVAVLSKTPLTTLAILLASAIGMLHVLRHRALANSPLAVGNAALLFIPALVLFLSIASAGINIGLRHMLPLYPFLFLAAGVAAARFHALRPKVARVVLPALAVCLAAETLPAYPNFIPFFNLAAGGSRGGFELLGDSNLDWGQDLPLLAEWQRKNPTRTLHLSYFGLADPAHYGIRYRNLPYGYVFGPELEPDLPTTGVLAVSATTLQGLYNPDPRRTPYAPLRHRKPTQILGGSIYLFDLGGD